MNRLKELRESKKMSRPELAKVLGVSPKTVQAWEDGNRTPKTPMMQHIEDYFGVRKEQIFFAAFSYEM